MAASGGARQPRRGPAPIASFDHDVSDESSPETKQAFRLPEIREDSSSACGDALAPPEQRARSHSTPAAGALAAPPAPRIDISRASSSSHQDSRDSSPELALFSGAAPAGALGFREDGALDLRSSTEELAFLEPAPGERAPPPPADRRHSRKDSQGSEAALLAVSGRTSRLSSVGSQCSAHSALSALSRVSRLSVASAASAASRSPSPHRMLLETSFCGPKPIETDPDVCGAAVELRLREMALDVAPPPPPAPAPPVDARDRREVRTEATVERPAPRPPPARAPDAAPAPPVGWAVTSPSAAAAPPIGWIATAPSTAAAPASVVTSPSQPSVRTVPAVVSAPPPDDDKRQKETRNRVKAEERRARSRERRDSAESRTGNRSKDIIRIRLKPDSEYEDDDDEEVAEYAPAALKPATLELGARPARPAAAAAAAADAPRKPSRDSRTPSPAGAVVSRKSSFCSLFKSRETIASPESPSDALRRKKSLNEGRSRSRSRDRSATPTSATKIKGSVLSLFKTPRKSATSPSPSSRDGSPGFQPQRQIVQPARPQTRAEKLKYYEDEKIIHIPLRTPPDEAGRGGDGDARPASAPQQRAPPAAAATASSAPPSVAAAPSTSGAAQVAGARSPSKPIQRTVLPDGSIIIPLRSPTERTVEDGPLGCAPVACRAEERRQTEASSSSSRPASAVEVASVASSGPISINSGRASASPPETAGASGADVTPSPDPAPPPPAAESSKRRERLVFMTQVGSGDQVFSTQFSITKTPSVTSEISGSLPSFPESEAGERPRRAGSSAASPQEPPDAPHDAPDTTKDSSESEASSEAGTARGGNEVERRGLVVQESFEEELPYVPTTLPQERSLALPMVPVRERGCVRVARVERPRPPQQPHRPQERRRDQKRNGSTLKRCRSGGNSRNGSRRCRPHPPPRRPRETSCSATWSPTSAAASATRGPTTRRRCLTPTRASARRRRSAAMRRRRRRQRRRRRRRDRSRRPDPGAAQPTSLHNTFYKLYSLLGINSQEMLSF